MLIHFLDQASIQITFKSNFIDPFALHMRHVPEDGEDDESGQEAGQAVDAAGDDGVAIAVVVELVVAREGQQGAEAGAQREKDLRGRVDPHLRGLQLLPLRGQVVGDAVRRPRQRDAPEQQDDQHHIRSQGRHPNRLKKTEKKS